MKKIISFGEIMLRLAPKNFLRFSQATEFEAVYGGAESNVAVSLAHFGLPVEFVTRLPLNEIGECASMELRKHGVGTNHVIFGGERLGLYFLENGAVNRGSKVIYDRSHSSISEIQKGMIDWDKVFRDAHWFHWTGITPGISQSASDVCLEALEAADRLGLTISADLNYRSKLWKYGKKPREILEQMFSYCDLISYSTHDAEQHFDIYPKTLSNMNWSIEASAEAYASVCEQMKKKFPGADKMVTSYRNSKNASHNSWGGFLYDGNNLLKSPVYEITHIVDRVGGGDSFMAGLIYGLNVYDDGQKALDFAVAASALKHTIYGDVNLVTVEEVEKLMVGDGSGRVDR